MSKLDAVKEKLATLRARLGEKTDKIGFLRTWKEKRAKAAAAGPKAADPHSLSAIYRDGSTGTRLQVIAFYLFVLIAVVSAGSLVKKIVVKMRSTAANDEMRKDISQAVTDLTRKKVEEAEMLALGQFTTNIFTGEAAGAKLMNIDLWIRVSDPGTATLVNTRNEVFREKTMDALNDLYVRKVNLLSAEGKTEAREKIRSSLNSALKHGKVEEVFIQNLVVE
jgi:flagellar basal body-associated protein FliL